jgi:hypothetical protein
MADDLMLLDLHDEGLAEVPQFAATSASSPPKQERVRATLHYAPRRESNPSLRVGRNVGRVLPEQVRCQLPLCNAPFQMS